MSTRSRIRIVKNLQTKEAFMSMYYMVHGSICLCIIPACLYDHDSCHAELVTQIT